jgi:hypothetical protein
MARTKIINEYLEYPANFLRFIGITGIYRESNDISSSDICSIIDAANSVSEAIEYILKGYGEDYLIVLDEFFKKKKRKVEIVKEYGFSYTHIVSILNSIEYTLFRSGNKNCGLILYGLKGYEDRKKLCNEIGEKYLIDISRMTPDQIESLSSPVHSEEEYETLKDILSDNLCFLDISSRPLSTLSSVGIKRVFSLYLASDYYIRSIYGIGNKGAEEIESKCYEVYKFKFAKSKQEYDRRVARCLSLNIITENMVQNLNKHYRHRY